MLKDNKSLCFYIWILLFVKLRGQERGKQTRTQSLFIHTVASFRWWRRPIHAQQPPFIVDKCFIKRKAGKNMKFLWLCSPSANNFFFFSRASIDFNKIEFHFTVIWLRLLIDSAALFVRLQSVLDINLNEAKLVDCSSLSLSIIRSGARKTSCSLGDQYKAIVIYVRIMM